MINISINSISKIFASVVVFLVLPGVIYYFYMKSDQAYQSQKLSFDEGLSEFLTQLNKRWRYGDIEAYWGTDKFQCSDIPRGITNISPEFFKCNPVYMKCWLSGGIDKVNPIIKTKNYTFKSKPKGLSIVDKGDLKLDFQEETTGKEFSVKLERSCHQAYLPQKIYSSGPDANSADIWDNYGRKIFIDKYYVSNWDIKLWKSSKLNLTDEDLNPAMNLSKADQKKYCFSRGKKLLQNHIFEAATFYPSVFKNGYVFKSKVPWSKVPREGELSNFDESICLKSYTLECNKIKKWNNYSDFGVSWNGIYHSLGSEVEFLENLFHKEANLKISSKYTAINSLWNLNSRRGTWNGHTFAKDSFKFIEYFSQKSENISFEKLKGVAFRCMTVK